MSAAAGLATRLEALGTGTLNLAARLGFSLPDAIGRRRKARRELGAYRQQFPRTQARRAHSLPGELIVSLTSYRPRFPTLAYTLASLFDQTVEPDRIVLWVAEHERAQLPREIARMPGLQVEFVEDVRSYKKLVFALERFPDAFIATCDDDIFYTPRWLEELVEAFDPAAPAIACHRAHRFPSECTGQLAPYRTWEWDVQDDAARKPSADLMPTGVGGVLYYPGSLDPLVTDSALFRSLCPDADDLWFFWQARRAGSLYRKVGAKFPLLYWDGTQDQRLFNTNDFANDRQIQRLLEHFGAPGPNLLRETARV